MIPEIARIRNRKTGRVSSWDMSGRNIDIRGVPARGSRILAEIDGPAQITHIWMTQAKGYRDCLLRFYWDHSDFPSIEVPLGDFFCLGHGIVNSFQSALFSASTNDNNRLESGCALNCYVPMPFRSHCKIELVNESSSYHAQYFYFDYETLDAADLCEPFGYFHAEFRRANPFRGWAPEITVGAPESNAACKEQWAWDNNYVILDTKGRGHYIGCNLSITNFQGTWWGEGDDMIWVDGYKWPPDLHGTGSEDYLNQAWGMQPNAFQRNGSSVFEPHNLPGGKPAKGGYQTSYVFHLENPVRFTKEIRVSIEHGHANHLTNEVASVAYWYAEKPTPVIPVPPVAKRMPVRADNTGKWLIDPENQCPGPEVTPTAEMLELKAKWAADHPPPTP